MTTGSAHIFSLIKSNSMDELKALLKDDPSAADMVNEQHVTLLMTAVYYRNKEAIELIKKYKLELLSPWEAACTGEITELQHQLVSDPSFLNKSSPDGFSLLGYACFFEQEAIAKFLIAKGADVNAPSANMMKVAPLHSAAAVSNFDLCKLLLERGANPNAVQQGGYTPLHAAAQNGRNDIAKLLLEYWADKSLLTDKGESAVDLATGKGHKETAELIREYKL